jgi:soluble lytic murein transglycosylase-like protein
MSKHRSASILRRADLVVASLCAALSMAAGAHPTTECIKQAGARYQIDPLLIWSIAKTESGFKADAIGRNKNKSYDIGMMQINSGWLPTLARHGITERHLYDPCTNIQVGTWILAQNVQKFGYNWKAVGAYNAVSENKRIAYARKVLSLAHKTAERGH